MDQARHKIYEILQNHNIAFNKAPATTLQSAIQQRLDLSSKIRNFPEISDMQERRRKDKVMKKFKGMRQEARPNSFQHQLQESHDQVIGLAEAWHNQKEHVIQLTNPFQDLSKKMYGTQADFSKMQNQLRAYDSMHAADRRTLEEEKTHAKQSEYHQSCASPLFSKNEEGACIDEGKTIFKQSPGSQKYEIVDEKYGNFVTQVSSPKLTEVALRRNSNPKTGRNDYLDHLRAKYIPEVSRALGSKERRLLSPNKIKANFYASLDSEVFAGYDRTFYQRANKLRSSFNKPQEKITCRNQKEIQGPVLRGSPNKKLSEMLKRDRSKSVSQRRSSNLNSPNPASKRFEQENPILSPENPLYYFEGKTNPSTHNLAVNTNQKIQTKQSGSSSKADNKYPADFTNILKKFTNNGTRIKSNRKSYNNNGSASPHEFPLNYDPNWISTTNEYNSYLYSHYNLTKDLDYVQIYHPNSTENRLLMYWQN